MAVPMAHWLLAHGSLACAAHDAELVCVGEGGQVILAECCSCLGIRKRQSDAKTRQVFETLHPCCRETISMGGPAAQGVIVVLLSIAIVPVIEVAQPQAMLRVGDAPGCAPLPGAPAWRCHLQREQHNVDEHCNALQPTAEGFNLFNENAL